MNKDLLNKVHAGLDKIIETCADDLSSDDRNSVAVEKDTSIILVCAALTKDSLPPVPDDDEASLNKDLMREWLKQIAKDAEASGGDLALNLLDTAYEFAYEFDEELASEFNDLKEKVQQKINSKLISPLEEEDGGVDPPVPPSAASIPGVMIPDEAAEPSIKELEKGEHVNDEGTEGYGYEVMKDDFKEALRFDLGIPDGGEVPDIKGWRYSEPADVLAYQMQDGEVPRKVVVKSAIKEVEANEDGLSLKKCERSTPTGPCILSAGHIDGCRSAFDSTVDERSTRPLPKAEVGDDLEGGKDDD